MNRIQTTILEGHFGLSFVKICRHGCFSFFAESAFYEAFSENFNQGSVYGQSRIMMKFFFGG